MLTPVELRAIAASRLEDAQILLANARYDGAGYICGYAIELSLKARICDTLNWGGYPMTRKEFENLQTFKTHNLDVLLLLSGREQTIKQSHFADWSIVGAWNPEARYTTVGSASPTEANAFVQSTATLLPIL
ncbi:MAG: hypothetical protein ABMA01_18645 [Chthoniobacteraceae bacterium]